MSVTSGLICARCGSVAPIGASLSYLDGWGYCPICFPTSTSPAFPSLDAQSASEIARLRAEVERLTRERDEATRAFHSLWSVSGDCLKAAKEPDRNPWIGEEPWKRHVREMAEIEKGALGITLARAETAEARVAALEAELSHLRRLIRSSPLGHFGGWRGYTTQIPESAVDRIDALLAPADPRDRAADTATAKAALDSYLKGWTDSHGFPVKRTAVKEEEK